MIDKAHKDIDASSTVHGKEVEAEFPAQEESESRSTVD